MLDTPDVPPGSVLDPEASGPHDRELATGQRQLDWLRKLAPDLVRLPGYERVWIDERERRIVVALVIEYPLDFVAGMQVGMAVRDLRSRATRELPIPAVPTARGFVLAAQEEAHQAVGADAARRSGCWSRPAGPVRL